jgi:ribosomal protein L37AE/L43A
VWMLLLLRASHVQWTRALSVLFEGANGNDIGGVKPGLRDGKLLYRRHDKGWCKRTHPGYTCEDCGVEACVLLDIGIVWCGLCGEGKGGGKFKTASNKRGHRENEEHGVTKEKPRLSRWH